jgi:HPt (histidine-containing phosphotransfer) domain-containing protein
MVNDVLDAPTLADLREAGDELLFELIEIFVHETPQRLSVLMEAIATNDCALAERTAHTLKSSAATFGATSMRTVAAEAEMAAHSGQLDRIGPMFESLKHEFEYVREALEAERLKLS